MRAAKRLAWGAAVLAAVAAAALLPSGWIVRAESGVAAWSGWFGAARLAAIAAAWVWWDALVARVPGIGAEGAAHLRTRRTFWIGALLAVELAVVRNVFGALWTLAA